jgi:fluoroquinolone transport system permease protein
LKRLTSTIKTDLKVQLRNKLYHIGIAVSLLLGIVLSQLVPLVGLARGIPVIVLLVSGGGGLLYIAALIMFEKDEGTLSAIIVSPLRVHEYLLSKVITLTFLAVVESVVIIGVTMIIMSRSAPLIAFNIPMLLVGIAATGVMYTLIGVIISVPFKSITDMIVPLITVGLVFQLPFLHFLGLLQSPLFLIVPTSAPATLMAGAFNSAAAWQWVYGFGYTAAWTVVLACWARASFRTYIITRMG